MKYIVAPEPLELEGLLYSFFQAVTYVLDHSEAFARPVSRIRMAKRILDASEQAAKAGDVIELRDEDWQLLDAECAAAPALGVFSKQLPSGELVPFHVPPRLFLPFLDAINEATNERKKHEP